MTLDWIDLEYYEIFYQESSENLSFLEDLINAIDGSVSQTDLDHLFRIFHSLKGIAGMMGLETLSEANHLIENKLKLIDANTSVDIESVTNWLLMSRDCLHDMVQEIAASVEKKEVTAPSLESYYNQLKDYTVSLSLFASTVDGATHPDSPQETMILDELSLAIDDYIEKLEEYVKESNLNAVQAILHTMKGDCAVFDKRDLAGFIHAIEEDFENSFAKLKDNFEQFKYCIVSNIYHDQNDLIDECKKLICSNSFSLSLQLDSEFIHALKKFAQLIKRGLVENESVENELMLIVENIKKWESDSSLESFFALLNTCEMVGFSDLSQNTYLKNLVSEIRFLISQFKESNQSLTEQNSIVDHNSNLGNSDLGHRVNEEKNNDIDGSKVTSNKKVKDFFKIEEKFVNNLIDISSEFVVAKNILLHSYNELIKKNGVEAKELEYVLKSINRLSADLQDNVIKMRLIPCKDVFKKAPKIVRDISRKQQKKIELIVKGEDTEIDKTIGEKVSDALLHIIRNSCDHGIETPLERSAAGKDVVGQITLSARYEQSFLRIDIKDDGKGINIQKVRNKILENQILTNKQVSLLSDEEIAYYIFHPGLSTAEEVSDISGRGVGMDVVKSNIESLGGTVELKTTEGSGSHFSLCIPVNTAVKRTLIVESMGEHVGFLLDQVGESIKTSTDKIFNRFGESFISYRNKIIKVINSHDPSEKKVSLVLFKYQGHSYAYIVNKFIGHQELVIKEAPRVLKVNKEILGVSVLGDGRAVIIQDLFQLASSSLQKGVSHVA